MNDREDTTSVDDSDQQTEESSTKQAPETISSRKLLGAARRLLIEHQGQHYELRETRRGRLILTK